MSGNPADLRVVRTQRAIRSALIALIEEKGFEAMSVKDITERANINRGTFYSHYEDKYDLMEKCHQHLIEEMEINHPQHPAAHRRHEAHPGFRGAGAAL